MRKIWHWYLCWIGRHSLKVVKEIAPGWRQIKCRRCGQLFAMHDAARYFGKWGYDDEDMKQFCEAGDMTWLH